MKASNDIEIRLDYLGVALAGLLCIALVVIGWVASPQNSEGRPLLLSPDVRAVEAYRRNAKAWAEDWQALDAALNNILNNEGVGGELLTTSRLAQDSFESAMRLSRNVESADAPAPLIGLHDQAMAIAEAYVQASLAAARWVSAPTPDHEKAAQDTLAAATSRLQELLQNEWIGEITPP